MTSDLTARIKYTTHLQVKADKQGEKIDPRRRNINKGQDQNRVFAVMSYLDCVLKFITANSQPPIS